MTYRANRFMKKLDSLAEYTGMPALARGAQQDSAMPFRVAPLLILAVGAVGLFMQTRVPEAGWITIMGVWTAGMPLWLTGPMRLPPGGLRDERERALVRSGHFAGMAAVALLVIGGCFLIGFASVFSLLGWVAPPWTPRLFQDWLALGFFC